MSKYSVKVLAAFLAVAVMAGGMPASALAATNENTAEVVSNANEAETNEDTAEVASETTAAEPNEDITQVKDEATKVATDETTDETETAQEIIAFADLAEETAKQTVLYGTTQEELFLPNTMTVTLQTVTKEEELTQMQEEETINKEEASSSETKEQEILVKWKASPSYDAKTPETYCFTPVIEEFEVKADLPLITITVKEEQKTEEVSLQQTVVEANQADVSGTEWKITGTVLTIETDAGMSGWISKRTNEQRQSIKSVVIKTGVSSIGAGAFSWCSGLTSIEIPSSVTSIGERAFYSSGLTNVKIPSGVTSIGNIAFKSCSNLASVVIPSSVISIKSEAFCSCTRLSEVTFLGENPPNIESQDFAKRPTIYVPKDSVELYGAIANLDEYCWEILPNINSYVTVNQGNGTGNYDKYVTVTIEADQDTDKRVFDSWSVSDGVALVDPTSRKTTFVMPGKDVTIIANYINKNNKSVTIRGDLEGGSYAGNGKINNGNILDGIDVPTGNTLTFDSGSGIISKNSYFYGGFDESGANVTNNIVDVNGGTFSNNGVDIYGGLQASSDSGNATDNTVTLTSFSGIMGLVCGGSSQVGTANNNQIIMNGGEVDIIYGGKSSNGNASNNSIIITGGTVNKQIIGGQNNKSNTSATGNTITLAGNANFSVNAIIAGGSNTENADCFSGNTLNIKRVGLSIGILANFQYVNFVIPASVKAEDTILTTSTGALLYNQVSDPSIINISVDNDSPLQIGNQITLIDASTGNLWEPGLTGITVSDKKSGYDFSLSVENNKLIATVTNQSYQVNVKNGTGSGTYKSGKTVTITAGTAPNGQTFDSWTSEDGVTFDNANNATTTFTMPAKSVTITANYKTSKVEVAGMTLSQTSADLKAGDTLTLNNAVTPSNATDPSVTWSSSNTDIATVDENGTVTGKGIGSAIITATSNSNTAITTACTINVSIGKVTGLTAKKNKTTSITLTWEAQNNVDGYKVYRYDSAKKKYVNIATIKKDSTVTYTDKKRSVATAYKYKVRAYVKINKKTKYGSYSSILKTATVSKKPTLSTKAGSKKATLTWDKVSEVSGYEIYMSIKKNSDYSKIKTVNSKTTKYTKKKLTKGKTYYFKIRTYKKVNGVKIYSSYSSVKKIKIK